VRIICATNRNLQECVSQGTFRSDLYYRLNVFPLEVPPLRERQSDILQLATFFLARYSRNLGKKMEGISSVAAESLKNYSWPGNVRELQNVIERALILSPASILGSDNELINIPVAEANPEKDKVSEPEVAPAAEPSPSAALKTLEEVERAHICAVLQQTQGVVEGANGAAKTLGIHPNTLRHRMAKLGISRTPHHIS